VGCSWSIRPGRWLERRRWRVRSFALRRPSPPLPCGARGCWTSSRRRASHGISASRHPPTPAATPGSYSPGGRGGGRAGCRACGPSLSLLRADRRASERPRPDVVTWAASGRDSSRRASRVRRAYMAGLMGFRRRQPTPLVPARSARREPRRRCGCGARRRAERAGAARLGRRPRLVPPPSRSSGSPASCSRSANTV